MRVPFLDLKAQHAEVRETINSSVLEVLETGAFVLGKHNKALEESVANLHGCAFGIAVNSGTDALRIMLQAGGIGQGDEVITCAFTFVASVEAILQVGAKPVFIDIEPATFNMEPGQIESAITARTKAIMPIHLFGQLADMPSINEIAQRNGLTVYEDAAQVVVTHQGGKYAGKFGKAAGLSFYVTKNLGAAGDGGMILTDDPEVDARSRSLRVHGMGRERYYYDEIGYTSRMAEVQAAVLNAKLTRLLDWNSRRAEIAAQLNEGLAGTCVTTPITFKDNHHTWHQYSIRCERRDALQAFLKEREIDSMIYYPVPLHFHEPYKHLGAGKGSLPETEQAAEQVLCLPIHPHLTDEQVQWVVQSVREFSPVGAAH